VAGGYVRRILSPPVELLKPHSPVDLCQVKPQWLLNVIGHPTCHSISVLNWIIWISIHELNASISIKNCFRRTRDLTGHWELRCLESFSEITRESKVSFLRDCAFSKNNSKWQFRDYKWYWYPELPEIRSELSDHWKSSVMCDAHARALWEISRSALWLPHKNTWFHIYYLGLAEIHLMLDQIYPALARPFISAFDKTKVCSGQIFWSWLGVLWDIAILAWVFEPTTRISYCLLRSSSAHLVPGGIRPALPFLSLHCDECQCAVDALISAFCVEGKRLQVQWRPSVRSVEAGLVAASVREPARDLPVDDCAPVANHQSTRSTNVTSVAIKFDRWKLSVMLREFVKYQSSHPLLSPFSQRTFSNLRESVTVHREPTWNQRVDVSLSGQVNGDTPSRKVAMSSTAGRTRMAPATECL
jgi:hypothetical protein